KEAVEAEGRRIEFFQGNLLDQEYRKALVDKCMEVYGRIDILVNNAGASTRTPFAETSDEDYNGDVELMLNVGFYLCRDVGTIMKNQGGGKIINIGSELSFTGGGGNPSYSVSKHAVIGLTRSVAATFRNDNVQCNAICPGFFKSPINAGVSNAQGHNNIMRRLPKGEYGAHGVLMGTAVYLASAASDYVSGAYILVDGGFAAGYF
ncbi:MAG: SDR family oxidoreductase, partial [Clostridiales bacterium]|nr:SDR family oxidoreductase [Clostridiales bacterium]